MPPLVELQHRGGHGSVQALMRYQHATDEGDQRLANALDDLLVDARDNRAMNAPLVDGNESISAVSNTEVDDPQPHDQELRAESGRRESNPRSQLGKLMFCR